MTNKRPMAEMQMRRTVRFTSPYRPILGIILLLVAAVVLHQGNVFVGFALSLIAMSISLRLFFHLPRRDFSLLALAFQARLEACEIKATLPEYSKGAYDMDMHALNLFVRRIERAKGPWVPDIFIDYAEELRQRFFAFYLSCRH